MRRRISQVFRWWEGIKDALKIFAKFTEKQLGLTFSKLAGCKQLHKKRPWHESFFGIFKNPFNRLPLRNHFVLSSSLEYLCRHFNYMTQIEIFWTYLITKWKQNINFIKTVVFRFTKVTNASAFIRRNLSDCNWTPTHNHLFHKQTLNH